jgi:hypothetical protein
VGSARAKFGVFGAICAGDLHYLASRFWSIPPESFVLVQLDCTIGGAPMLLHWDLPLMFYTTPRRTDDRFYAQFEMLPRGCSGWSRLDPESMVAFEATRNCAERQQLLWNASSCQELSRTAMRHRLTMSPVAGMSREVQKTFLARVGLEA